MGKDGTSIIRRPSHPIVKTIKRGLELIQAPLTFDMDIWEGVKYGPEAEQNIDLWELNDLAPRDGWPAVMFINDDGWIEGAPESFRIQAPLLARRGIVGASASYRSSEAQSWQVQLSDILSAIEVLKQLQTDPTRIALWGVGSGGDLALAAAARLGPEKIRCVATFDANEPSVIMEDSGVPTLNQKSGIKNFKAAHSWLGELLTDKQRGSKWKIRRKKKKK
jgi:hypothetical protein